MFNLATVLESSALSNPEKTAIVFSDKSFSYTQINGAANKIANGLKQAGIKKGDKVALSCPNLPYFPMVYYGILKAGAAVVPLNVLFKSREVAYHLKDSEASAYFCFQGTEEMPIGKEGWEGFQKTDTCKHFWMMTADPDALSPIEEAATLGSMMENQPAVWDTVQTIPEDTAVILYTSGTTGQPKGAELSHFNMYMNADITTRVFRLQKDDVQLITLPLFHSFGQTTQMNAGFLMGNKILLIPRFEPQAVLSGMQTESVTVFCGVPTMYWALLNYPELDKFDLDKISAGLRVAVSGGASMPVEIMKKFETKFNVEILEGYGLSETSPVASFNRFGARKPGSIGFAIWGVDIKVIDDKDNDCPVNEPGELVIRGHNVMKGYYKKPDETKTAFKNDWFHSGDVAQIDEDGYIFIVDRIKDMILRGGYNVYPREIEEVLMTHPDISLAAVVGIPNDKMGEEIKAFVVLNEGSSITPEELVAWSKSEMASYKYPRIFEIVDSLPMTATGKILKKELRG